MIVTATYAVRPRPVAHRPATLAHRPMAAPSAERFGACVNRGTSAQNAIDLIMRGSLHERLHIVAEMGRAGTFELANVLTQLIHGEKGFMRVITAEDPQDKLKSVTILSILKAYEHGELTGEQKKHLLDSLKRAGKKGYMQGVKKLLEYAIKKMEGEHVHEDEEIRRAIHDYQHAAGEDHHHH